MSTLKHTVNTDALETLGNIIDSNAARDAIHIAVEPVKAGMLLRPGQHVGWLDDTHTVVMGKMPGSDLETIGIVDPFLRQPVLPGNYCWLLVYPREITSLRHVWSHPKF